MSLLSTLTFITTHPLAKRDKLNAISRFLKWQIRCRISKKPYPFSFVDKTFLVIEKGMTGATGNLYTGLHEFSDMGFLLHFLRETDLFIDIGANVGSYTILASGVKRAETLSFEPSQETFQKLQRNVQINKLDDLVIAHNIGLGSETGILKFTKSLDTVNHIVKGADHQNGFEDIEVKRLDDLLPEFQKPTLIKIDVEGFETEVLMGAEATLINQNLKAIIIELNGSGGRYGFDENKIHKKFMSVGFTPYIYDPLIRKLTKSHHHGLENTIYIRDYSFVQERVSGSDKISVLGISF
jgi:FkbM family methyltransferase